MKLIKENEKLTTIFLEDGEVIEICKMGKSSIRTSIKCTANTVHFDEITYKELRNLNEEKKALKALNKYLKKPKE